MGKEKLLLTAAVGAGKETIDAGYNIEGVSRSVATLNQNLFVKILLILLSIIVASISFNFVEKIFRKKMNIPIKKIIVVTRQTIMKIINNAKCLIYIRVYT